MRKAPSGLAQSRIPRMTAKRCIVEPCDVLHARPCATHGPRPRPRTARKIPRTASARISPALAAGVLRCFEAPRGSVAGWQRGRGLTQEGSGGVFLAFGAIEDITCRNQCPATGPRDPVFHLLTCLELYEGVPPATLSSL